MGMLVSAVAALSTFYLDAKEIFDPESRNKQIIRLIAKMPTLAAAAHRFSVGMPFVYPDNSLDFADNFLSMLWKVAEPRFEANPVLAHALDVLFILHADHEQNCSTTAMRVVGSSHSDPYSATAAAAAALYGPRHGGANEAVIRMLTDIGTIDNVPDFIATVKSGHGQRLQGFGHRVYKSYDPRAKIVKQIAYEVFEVTGKNPLLDIALKLEEIALSDEYFTSRHLYPNVDFYSGLIYQAMGFPMEMFTVLFSIPRTVGWLAHWQEMLDQDSKIARPRQLYIGSEPRDYVAITEPSSRPAPARGGVPGAGQALLDDRDAQASRPVEEEAAGQAPPGGRHRGVGVVEQPLVGPEGPVEPHAVVEAGAHEVGVLPADIVGGQDGVEERHVRGVGGDRRVEQRIVGQLAVGPDPQALVGLAGSLAMPGQIADVALVDRVGPLEPVAQLLPPRLEPLEERGERLGVGHLGHGELVVEALLEVVERGRQVEDGPPVLNGHHPPGGEGPAVANPVDLVEDRDVGVAGAQEVRVQRVDLAVLDGPPGRDQGLPRHLPAEDPLALLVGLDAPEDVHLNRLEIEQVDEELERCAHAPHDRRPRRSRRRRARSPSGPLTAARYPAAP